LALILAHVAEILLDILKRTNLIYPLQKTLKHGGTEEAEESMSESAFCVCVCENNCESGPKDFGQNPNLQILCFLRSSVFQAF
jgi:hypothetical protein